jgi:hypothetical protein
MTMLHAIASRTNVHGTRAKMAMIAGPHNHNTKSGGYRSFWTLWRMGYTHADNRGDTFRGGGYGKKRQS